MCQWSNLKPSGRILSKFLPIIEHLHRTILSIEKIRVLKYFFPGVYMAWEIQVMAWDRHKHMVGLNWLMQSYLSSSIHVFWILMETISKIMFYKQWVKKWFNHLTILKQGVYNWLITGIYQINKARPFGFDTYKIWVSFR